MNELNQGFTGQPSMMDNSFHNSEDNDLLFGLQERPNLVPIEHISREPIVEKTLTVLEYLKIELAQILP